MEKLISYLPYIVAGSGIWAFTNGVLHDIFVMMSEHGRQYDRNLLRLLLDGHVLITCGLVSILCYGGIKAGQPFALYIALVAALSLLAYCAMIWPFLKSMVTIVINLSVTIVLIAAIIKNSSI